ncbi:MAG: GNAT family N-acetyltransferase [Gemmatimonadetes bacterium]|nr:GNAT family N-acetyltransferase [Gemmatimonadota bacterium]
MSSLTLRRHAGPEDFLASAQDWLVAREAEHNLLLGIVGSLLETPGRSAQAVYLATLSEGEDIVGCAFRTPPFKVGVTRLPDGGGELLAQDLAQVYEHLPAVLGPPDSARALGRAWARLRGLEVEDGTAQRIYALDRVRMPADLVKGFMRPAVRADLEQATRWMTEFIAETTLQGAEPGEVAVRLIDAGALAVWEDAGPVAMAGFSGATANTVRVSYVYTPPECRSRGYATALVAHLSRYLLETRCRQCVLYTDLGNPTSNRIYMKLGYTPVADALDVLFTSPDDR